MHQVGFLAVQLGIKPISRIAYWIEDDGLIVWDLGTRNCLQDQTRRPEPTDSILCTPGKSKRNPIAALPYLKEWDKDRASRHLEKRNAETIAGTTHCSVSQEAIAGRSVFEISATVFDTLSGLSLSAKSA